MCGEDYARVSSKSNELLLGQQLLLSRELELVEIGQKSLDEAIATVRSETQAVLDQTVNEMKLMESTK
ncbi:hypothetical protein [Paenibacillus sp. FSL K6-2524]|uniref:hypothetical protein n=1 Tax=Paenibacillus sp. FSL K6-2524 TaxID=2954516 RepID=UPI0030F961AD